MRSKACLKTLFLREILQIGAEYGVFRHALDRLGKTFLVLKLLLSYH